MNRNTSEKIRITFTSLTLILETRNNATAKTVSTIKYLVSKVTIAASTQQSMHYGDSVDDARRAILAMFDSDPRIVRHSLEEDRAERRSDDETDTAKAEEPARRGWLHSIFSSHRDRISESIGQLRTDDDPSRQMRAFTPTVNRQPSVTLGNLGASSVDLTVRAWVRSTDYWAVYYDFNERFYNELPAAGINFPFPQLDVHLQQSKGIQA